MSHYCTMHHPPLSSKWTGKNHEGERTLWRLAHPSCPFKAPTTPQNHHRGTTLRRAPSMSLPSFSKSKSSLFSTLQADVGGATHVRRILWQDGLFSGRCFVLGESDHRPEDSSGCCLQSALQTGCLLTSERLRHPSHCFQVKLDCILCGAYVKESAHLIFSLATLWKLQVYL